VDSFQKGCTQVFAQKSLTAKMGVAILKSNSTGAVGSPKIYKRRIG
jgi:hypothetical protein